MRVLSVQGVLPEHRYPLAEITHAFTRTMLRSAVNGPWRMANALRYRIGIRESSSQPRRRRLSSPKRCQCVDA